MRLSAPTSASADEGTKTVTIAANQTSADLTVPTQDDSADEADGSVTATVASGTGYTVGSPSTATVAVADNDAVATNLPTFSISDATADENGGGQMVFTVRLDRPVTHTVKVTFTTRESTPVSARHGEDYYSWWQDGLQLPFYPGRTEQRVWVYIYNDNHDEDPETFEAVLSNPTGGTAIGKGVAVATITNSDPMPAAWLARFGRTAAEQALDGIAGRIAAPRSAGVQGTLAGQALTFGGAGPDGSGSGAPGAASHTAALADTGFPGTGLRTGSGADRPVLSETAERSEWGTPAFGTTAERFAGSGWEEDAYGPGASRPLTLRDALLGSHFTATGETDASGGSLAFWGRAAQSRFDGREGTFSLDGETTTALLGADYARGDWLLGLALMQGDGDGGYTDYGKGPQACPDDIPPDMRALCDGAVREGDGEVEASLTAALPYAAFQASEGMKLWGLPAFGGRFTGSPSAGVGLSTGTRDYTLGWRLTPAANTNAPDVSFGAKAIRRERDAASPEHITGLEAAARW